jgi:hypothetical protein
MANKQKKPKSVYARFPPPKFKTGDWVRFAITPWYTPTVQIIGYRGPLGEGGDHKYRFRQIDEYGQVMESELSESAIVPADPPNPLPVPALPPDPDY